MSKRIINTFIGKIEILKIPGDGNCLFATVCTQLYGTIPRNVQHHQKITMLRKLVSSHILKHPEIYQSSLLAAATEAFPYPTNESDNAIISRFIDGLKEDGFWGGVEKSH
jgi:hypothetical protein